MDIRTASDRPSPAIGSASVAGLPGFPLAGGVNSWFGLFGTTGFPRRWQYGHGSAGWEWVQIVSDLAIFAAYLSIPLAVTYFLRRRRDFTFCRVFGVFGAFVLLGGLGHAIEAISFWFPVYRLAALVKILTAIISWVAVIVIIRVFPKALKVNDLRELNVRLRREVQERKQVERELRRSEAEARKLAVIASRTDNAVILTDPHGAIEWVNDGFTRITGYSFDEVKGRKPGRLLQGPETDPAAVQCIRDHLSRGEKFLIDILNYSKTGQRYWIHINAEPIFDAAGTLIHFMAIESDITARKESEAALIALNDDLEARVEERTRELASTNDALQDEVAERRRTEAALIQRTRVATLAAEVGASLSGGTTLDEALNGCVEALVKHLDAAFARVWTLEKGSDTLILRASAGIYTHLDGPHGQIPVGQFKIGQIAADRRSFLINDIRQDTRIADQAWAEREGMVAFAGFPLIVDTRVVGVLALFSRQPIDEVLFAQLSPMANSVGIGIVRKWTKDNLRRSEERFHLASKTTKEVIWDWDIAAGIVSWSSGINNMLGCGAETVGTDRAWWDRRIHIDDRVQMLEGFHAALADDVQVWSAEYRVCRLDGSFIHILDRGFILRDDLGRPIRVIGAMMDLTERLQAELEIRDLNARLEQRLHRLDALRRIDVTISASLDLGLTLGIVVDQVQAQLRVDATAILLGDSKSGGLSYAATRGFRTDARASSRLVPVDGLAGLAVAEQRLIAIADLAGADLPASREGIRADEEFVTYHAVPLVARGQVQGVLEVYHRHEFDADHDWLSFLETLAGQAAIAVDNANLVRDLQRSHSSLVAAYDATIEGWARALDLRDKETEGHTRRVTEMTIRLARAMGLGNDEIGHMRRGALLHDIGKLGIPDSILLKPGKLTEDEWQVMRRHPGYAYEWLAPISFLRPAMDIPYCHHEKWDGTGYPRGLKGEQIPRAARIFAAVDIWDALRSDRPYRQSWPEAKVMDYLRTIAGTHLDPEVVYHLLWTLTNTDPLADFAIDDPRIKEQFRGLRQQLDAATGLIGRLEREGDQLKQANLQLASLSATDELTGLKNRRHFLGSFEAEFATAQLEGRSLSLLMLDVDHFKSFNDHLGHRAGDEVLQRLATILREHVRPSDLVARYGGEEFLMLLPDTDAATGCAVAERLRAAIADHPWPLRKVTASFGVATSEPGTLSPAELIEAADTALYRSKAAGRDQVTHRQDAAAEPMLSFVAAPVAPSLHSVA